MTKAAPSWSIRAWAGHLFRTELRLLIGITALFAFLWSIRSGQYDDVEGTAWRILSDEDLRK